MFAFQLKTANDSVYKVNESGSGEECREELEKAPEDQNKTEQEVNTSNIQVKYSCKHRVCSPKTVNPVCKGN